MFICSSVSFVEMMTVAAPRYTGSDYQGGNDLWLPNSNFLIFIYLFKGVIYF